MSRTHGTLTKWNDDRGFGFITPGNGRDEIFVHVSSFPREGGRPRLQELVSFEIETDARGRQRAVRVMRPARKPERLPARSHRRSSGRPMGHWLSLGTIVALAIFGVSRVAQQRSGASLDVERSAVVGTTTFTCDGREHCSQMSSCDEARFFLANCPNTKMDGDHDGVPCEDQHCGH